MKTLLLYTSHHGTTRKLAQNIAAEVKINPEFVVDFKKNKKIDLSEFDFIIIGSSIHVGTIPSDFKKFLLNNLDLLLTKKVGIFMCAMEKPEVRISEFENNFPTELRNHSIANGLLGGEFLFEKMNFFEKLIIKKISGFSESKSEIDYDAYNEFIGKLKLAT